MGDWPAIGLKPFFDSVLAIDTATFAITNIPQDAKYRNLAIELSVRGTSAGTVDYTYMQLNGDTTAADYYFQRVQAFAANVIGAESLASLASLQVGFVAQATATAGRAAATIVNIPNYNGTTFHKAYTSRSGVAGGTTTGLIFTGHWGGAWLSTAAISSISLFPATGNFLAGSRCSAYVY